MELILGTAQWGWTVDKPAAFGMLETWMAYGLRAVDAATNYPINKRPEDFRAAEQILQEFVRTHGVNDLKITMKIGSLNNLRSPENNLAPSFLLMMAEEYLRLFEENLTSIMVHWDNRTDVHAITESLEALQTLQDRYQLRPGLSGIANPEIYAVANNETGLTFDIQLKHNVFQSDLGRYKPFYGIDNRFFAYGINAGGVKLEGPYPAVSTFLARGGQPEALEKQMTIIRAQVQGWNTAHVRPPIKNMNHIGLIYAGLNPMLNGILVGAGTPDQLLETLDFWRNLEVFDYSDVWETLQKLAQPTISI